ncbi:MAG: 5-methyltetrahydropteroyltriglutamate--homocysteine methyltransferase [Magnetovibrio sp.]|nr:5-methyltetrahydropteroyltriglutamate--homocysteine methyltransferase [Magnetovibrio sp.]
MPLKTTTIGSYPKPTETPVDDWFMANKSDTERRKSKGLIANWNPGEYEKAISEAGDNAETLFLAATKQIINDQVTAGIDVPTDGEVRRENYIWYQCRNLNGISFDQTTHKSVRDGAYEADLPTINGAISLKETRLEYDWRAAQQFTKNPVKVTLPGPLTIADSIANNFYEDPKKLGVKLAEALNKEVRALAEAGCIYIQVDEPVFARNPDEALAHGFEDLERTFHGVPKGVVPVVHMCCGYPNALDSTDYKKADKGAYLKIAEAIEESCIQEVSIEDAHRHNELSLLENFSKTKVILGVVNISSSRLETVDEVRDRLISALHHIDKERLILAPDCGLGFFSREQAISKLKVVSAVAQSI